MEKRASCWTTENLKNFQRLFFLRYNGVTPMSFAQRKTKPTTKCSNIIYSVRENRLYRKTLFAQYKFFSIYGSSKYVHTHALIDISPHDTHKYTIRNKIIYV